MSLPKSMNGTIQIKNSRGLYSLPYTDSDGSSTTIYQSPTDKILVQLIQSSPSGNITVSGHPRFDTFNVSDGSTPKTLNVDFTMQDLALLSAGQPTTVEVQLTDWQNVTREASFPITITP